MAFGVQASKCLNLGRSQITWFSINRRLTEPRRRARPLAELPVAAERRLRFLTISSSVRERKNKEEILSAKLLPSVTLGFCFFGFPSYFSDRETTSRPRFGLGRLAEKLSVRCGRPGDTCCFRGVCPSTRAPVVFLQRGLIHHLKWQPGSGSVTPKAASGATRLPDSQWNAS